MSEYLKVDGFPGLVKNNETGLYVNVDSHEIEMARARKSKFSLGGGKFKYSF